MGIVTVEKLLWSAK